MTADATQKFCAFYLDDQLFGVESRWVQEVFGPRPITPVPHAPPAVRGLVNLRGQILIVIDLKRRLGRPAAPEGGRAMNVVVHGPGERPDGPVSLLVDRIDDVLEVGEATFEPPPETLGALERELIIGVYKLPGRLLHLIDICQVLDDGWAG
jgi:purine-binding chemotaxis protein CheW